MAEIAIPGVSDKYGTRKPTKKKRLYGAKYPSGFPNYKIVPEHFTHLIIPLTKELPIQIMKQLLQLPPEKLLWEILRFK